MLTGQATINGYLCIIATEGRQCSCKDFLYRRKDRGENCKHLNELEKRLKEEETAK